MESFDDAGLALLDSAGSLTSTHFPFLPVSPLRSAGVVPLGGAYREAPGWPTVVDTSTFVVSSGDVCVSRLFHLSSVNLFVQLEDPISHGRDFTLFRTSFLTLDALETRLEPLLLIIPHSVGTPFPLSWLTRQQLRHSTSRPFLHDVTRVPIFALISVTSVSTSVSDVSSVEFSWMEDYEVEEDDVLSLHSYHTDSGICIDDAAFIASDISTDSDASTSVHFTPSIEDLVGEAWLAFAQWADEICD